MVLLQQHNDFQAFQVNWQPGISHHDAQCGVQVNLKNLEDKSGGQKWRTKEEVEGKGGTGERYNSKCLQPSVKHGGVSAMNWSGWESCKNEWKYKCRQAASDFNHHAIPLRKQPTGNIVHFFFLLEKHKIKHYQSWNGLPRAWIATLLQHGIILTENKTNSSQDPKKSFVGTLFLPFMYL